MNGFREELLEKLTKAQKFQKKNKCEEVTLSFTERELTFVKLGVSVLKNVEETIEEEVSGFYR